VLIRLEVDDRQIKQKTARFKGKVLENDLRKGRLTFARITGVLTAMYTFGVGELLVT